MKRTYKKLSLAACSCLAAFLAQAADDKYWVAEDGNGNWADANWSTEIDGSGTTFDSERTALFHKPLNNIDLNGASPTIWTLRPGGSDHSASNPRVVNIYNTSPAESTFTLNSTGSDSADFKNLIVTFGGERSIGKVKVNNANYGGRFLKLAYDSHVEFADNSEYTEAGTKDAAIGNNNTASNSLTVAGGKVTINAQLRLGYWGDNKKSTGVVQIDSGEMFVTGGDIIVGETVGNTGRVVLNGGKLTAKHLKGGAGTGSLVFNGGRLVAGVVSENGLIASTLPVIVNGGGGAIDSDGKSVAIAADFSGAGGMAFVGGGTIALNGNIGYSGRTTVTLGTTLVVASETAKNNILSHGLVVAGVPTEVGQAVMKYASDLTGTDLSKVTCPLAPGTEFEIGGEGNTAIVVKTVGTALDNYWTGAADDGNLSNDANWKSGVPTTGNANIFSAAPVTLSKGATFAPSSITFLEDSARVTVEGDAITGIAAITNLSGVRPVFNCAVSGNEIEFNNTTYCCDFRGGITLATPTFGGTASNNARGLVGNWHFTGGWTPVPNNYIMGNSSVTVAGELLDPSNMSIDAGCVVTAATMRATTSTHSAWNNSGRLVVTGNMNIQNTSADFALARQNTQDATIIAGGIVYNTPKWQWLNAKTLVVGEDGINFDSSHNTLLRFSGTPTLYAAGATTTLHAGKDDLQAYSIKSGEMLTVCTTQFDSQEPSTITIDGKILQTYSTSSTSFNGGMAVTGNGTLVFNSESTFTGGLTVGGTATVKVNALCTPGSSDITLGAGTTLALTATSNTFSPLANAVALPTGENEKATIRIDGERLKSGNHTILSSVSGATDNVAIDLTSPALEGRNATLSVDGTDLVLTIEPKNGFILIVR